MRALEARKEKKRALFSQHSAMATVQKLPASSLSTANSYGACTVGSVVPDKFPVGLRVLVVDDDPACLKILEQMLRKCLYQGVFMFDLVLILRFEAVFACSGFKSLVEL